MLNEILCAPVWPPALRSINGQARVLRAAGTADLPNLAPWREKYDWPRWQDALPSSIEEEAFEERLQDASRRGRPLGNTEFVDNLEERCGRPLRARPVGRPKKLSEEDGRQLSLGYGV